MWKYIILAIFLVTTSYAHFRGRVRLKLRRQIGDHSTIMAPYNSLMYLFSAVPSTPYIDITRFPELKPIADQWQMIREEALKLFDDGYIKAAERNNDIGFNTFFKRGWKRFYL